MQTLRLFLLYTLTFVRLFFTTQKIGTEGSVELFSFFFIIITFTHQIFPSKTKGDLLLAFTGLQIDERRWR